MDELGSLNRDYVKDRKVCATGRLVSLTHDQLARLVEACGGTFIRYPTRSSIVLVIGDDGWPSEDDGSPSRVFKRARELRALGYPIDFVSEDDFLQRIGLTQNAEAIRGLHTIGDLARILGVSPVRIRRWVRSGLIEPVASAHRLAYFDFHQVAFARRISELLDSGASLASIRRGIEEIRDLLPQQQSQDALARLAKWERSGRILVRLDDKLIDGGGQTYFDFEAAEGAEATVAAPTCEDFAEVAHLFDAALQREDDDQPQEAADLYRRAVALQPTDPILHFNLGNVLFGLGRAEDAAACYREALRHDPGYAEAWNNLGNACAELSQWNDAAEALRSALRLVPGYADAHYNLAGVLKRLGRPSESAHHWRAYQEHSSADRLLAQRESVLRIFRGETEEAARRSSC